jgi:cytochrome bd ubiquinol oxidase subunit II
VHIDPAHSLNLIWFMLLGVLLTGYGILDGFDLGVGILHLIANSDDERRLIMNSIGPLWDGNEVWLVTFAGALFASFPDVYATALSSFYLAIMLILFGLIMRAVSIEFRSKIKVPFWYGFWDFSFFGSSTMVAFLFGFLIGHLFLGLPVGADFELKREGWNYTHFIPFLPASWRLLLAPCMVQSFFISRPKAPCRPRCTTGSGIPTVLLSCSTSSPLFLL